MLLLGSCNDVLIYMPRWLAVWIVCRTSILDPKTPANRHTGCHGHAMQILAVGHTIRVSFLRNAEQIQKN
jgi:hypothetical protein